MPLQSRVSRTITTTPLTPSSQNIPITTLSSTGKNQKEISTEKDTKETKDEKPSLPSPIQQSAGWKKFQLEKMFEVKLKESIVDQVRFKSRLPSYQ